MNGPFVSVKKITSELVERSDIYSGFIFLNPRIFEVDKHSMYFCIFWLGNKFIFVYVSRMVVSVTDMCNIGSGFANKRLSMIGIFCEE